MVVRKMNQYLIEHKIKTLAELWNGENPKIGKFDYQGYEFKQWDFTMAKGPTGNAWTAKRIISANNAVEAINNFRRKLSSIVDRITFISQCYTTMGLEPFIVIRENDNSEIKFLFRYTKEVNGIPLHFGKNEQKALKELETYEKQPVFKYLSESTRAGSYYTRLAMLIIALESIAGEKKDRKGNVHTDKEYIKNEILKDEILYKKIFGYKTGIRNKIFHGKEVEFDDNYADKIYQKIIEYFNRKYQIKINTGVVGPQRTFTGNYQGRLIWLKPRNNKEQIDLKDIIEEFKQYDKQEENSFLDKFSFTEPISNY